MEGSIELYDFAKQMAITLEPMDTFALNKRTQEVANFYLGEGDAEYLMLLCRERNDYTVFHIPDKTKNFKLANELSATLVNRGKVLAIDDVDDTAYEIWIRDSETSENFAYYLFNYTFGIVEVI